DRGDGAFASATAGARLDADGWGNARDEINIRAGELLDELAGVSVHRVQKPPLAFGKEQVESEGALSGATHAGDNDEAVAGNGKGEVFQVMLPGAMNGNGLFWRGRDVSALRHHYSLPSRRAG